MLIDSLWLNVSPSLNELDTPLLDCLAKKFNIAQWQYIQDLDEPNSLCMAMCLLDSYLDKLNYPVNLLGHGVSGLLALLYARRYPEKVRSLTLLSVGVYPAVDWQAHYYFKLQMLPCSRQTILKMMVQNLFNYSGNLNRKFTRLLDQDLQTSLSCHNLYQELKVFPGGVSVPMLICGSANDIVIDLNSYQGWQTWFKPGDRLWLSPLGRYFFHYFYPQAVSETILDYWQSLTPEANKMLI